MAAGLAPPSVGSYKPRGASRCVQAAILRVAWDGARFADVYEKTE
jgi:hypothetical protein